MPNHVENRITFNGDEKTICEMLEKIKYDEMGAGSLDFNKVVPMPESLNIEAGTRTNTGLKNYLDFLKVYLLDRGGKSVDPLNIPIESEKAFLKMRTDIKQEEWDLGKIAFQNQQRYGSADWHSWATRSDTWSTKWNSYFYNHLEKGYDKEQNRPIYENLSAKEYVEKFGKEISFSTAWSAPHPILENLSQMYPDLEIEHKWADEDLGYNCGEVHYKNGEITFENVPDGGSKEAYELAADLQGVDLEESYQLSEDGTTYYYKDDEELSLS